MKYEGFKLRYFIFQNTYKLERKCFSLFGDSNAVYEFMIHDIGHNALDISAFFKYKDIASRSNSVEKDLHNLISPRANLAATLASEANDKYYRLYNQKVDVRIENVNYSFKIDGVGPKAIKMTYQVTYDDIAASKNPLESHLYGIINDYYPLDNPATIKKINEEWKEKVEKQKELEEQILKEEDLKRKKQKELEEFLKS